MIAELYIYGGTIYTMEEDFPTVEAVAISGDRIIYAGSPYTGFEIYRPLNPNTVSGGEIHVSGICRISCSHPRQRL